MMYGYSFNEILAILGKMVVANNRMADDLQAKDEEIAKLKKRLAEHILSEEKRSESTD